MVVLGSPSSSRHVPYKFPHPVSIRHMHMVYAAPYILYAQCAHQSNTTCSHFSGQHASAVFLYEKVFLNRIQFHIFILDETCVKYALKIRSSDNFIGFKNINVLRYNIHTKIYMMEICQMYIWHRAFFHSNSFLVCSGLHTLIATKVSHNGSSSFA